MRYREAARKLAKLGCYEVSRHGDGSHRKWHTPQAQKDATFPGRGSRDLKIGTLRSAIRQLGIDWSKFQAS